MSYFVVLCRIMSYFVVFIFKIFNVRFNFTSLNAMIYSLKLSIKMSCYPALGTASTVKIPKNQS